MQRRESETHEAALGGGLGRKKSLAQRIRGMSRPERPSGALRSPEARYGDENSPTSPAVPPIRMAQSAGGPSKAQHKNETNPFDTLYDDAYDKKGASIKVAETGSGSGPENGDSSRGNPYYIGRDRAPSSPRRGLQRTTTADSGTDEPKPAGGFLNRVKSLKGGRRRRES